MRKYLIGAVALLGLIVLFMSTFSVDNTENIIVLRLGKPVRVLTEPGLHVKIPFLESTASVTKRRMYYTSQPSQVITRDKKSILIDNYCLWEVDDPLQLYLSVKNVTGATQRLDDTIYSGLRQELARHDLIEIINEQRRPIMINVTTIANEKAQEYGIKIVDIRIKRADLPKENEKNIFARMITERERVAKQYRSEGLEEAQKIKARTDMEVAVELAKAEKEAQIIRGEAEARAIELYANILSLDPDFYEFNKMVNFYTDTQQPMKIILTTDSALFKFLKQNK